MSPLNYDVADTHIWNNDHINDNDDDSDDHDDDANHSEPLGELEARPPLAHCGRPAQ